MTALNAAGYVLDAGDGEHTWFSGTLMSVKAGGEQTRAGFTLIEVSQPPRFVVPPHIHDDEEEAFYASSPGLGPYAWTEMPLASRCVDGARCLKFDENDVGIGVADVVARMGLGR